MMADELDQNLSDSARQPLHQAGDVGSYDEHPLPDKIEVDRYRKGDQVVPRRHRGIRISKIVANGIK